jgi:hypothetical protein
LEAFKAAIVAAKTASGYADPSESDNYVQRADGAPAYQFRDAIALLARVLPGTLARPATARTYSAGKYERLRQLAVAAISARGIIKAPKLPHRYASWHDLVCLFEWHIRALLYAARMPQIGDGADSPAVRVVAHALEWAGENRENDAIAKAGHLYQGCSFLATCGGVGERSSGCLLGRDAPTGVIGACVARGAAAPVR